MHPGLIYQQFDVSGVLAEDGNDSKRSFTAASTADLSQLAMVHSSMARVCSMVLSSVAQ